ncbi:MAG: hypothetical protein LUF35_14105 [Lachnospiraceae bacterium]|nr:hypothetical protein [Lachnospiraceae bacterium]
MKKQDGEFSLDERIKAAEDKVVEYKKPYDEALEELAALVKPKKRGPGQNAVGRGFGQQAFI